MNMNNAICSICTVNYSAYTGALNDSLRKAGHNESHYVLVVDYDHKYKGIIDKFRFTPVFLHDLKIPKVEELIKKYSAFELSNVLKPFFMEWVLKNHKEIVNLIYLDSDIFVLSSFNDIFDYLDKNKNISVAITPHIKEYETYSKITDYSVETTYMRYGLYNGGFYALKNNSDSIQFLGWLKSKLSAHGFNAPNANMFVDQKILDFAPILFDYVGVYRNKTYNVGHWNFFEYELVSRKGEYFIENKKLTFLHFSQLYIDAKDKNKGRLCHIKFKDEPVLKEIGYSYWDALVKNGHEEIKIIPYGYKDDYIPPPLSFLDPILAKSNELEAKKEEFNSTVSELGSVQSRYSQSVSQLASKTAELKKKKNALDSTRLQLSQTKMQLDIKTEELAKIYSDRGWRLVLYIRRILDKAFILRARNGLNAEPRGQELVDRYKDNYHIATEAVITEEMILHHWELEKKLTQRLLNSPLENRWKIFEECYTILYSDLPWLNLPVSSVSVVTKEDLDKKYSFWVSLVGAPQKKIYEVGSGKGELIRYLASIGHQCRATEITSQRGEKFTKDQPGLSWSISDGVHLNRFEPNNHYDVVISDQVIEHIHPDDLLAHFKGVKSILTEKGRYILCTPHVHDGPWDVSRVFKCEKPIGMHLKEYTYRELVKMLKRAGFKDIYTVMLPQGIMGRMLGRYSKSRVVHSLYLHYMFIIEGLIRLLPSQERRRRVWQYFARPPHCSLPFLVLISGNYEK